jgi:glycosyltransferase involved in cell wall biosynthesis
MTSISVVINTLNEETNLPKALASVKSLATQIIVVDMHSVDNTRTIAKDAGATVFLHDKIDYVEPARNFAISKANSEWILILDADEEVPKSLRGKIREILANPTADYYRLARKNIIFGSWIKHAGWWPDYNIRLFRKGFVQWNEIIHSVPTTTGKGGDIPSEEEFAIVHHNYNTIEQYIDRLNRYTSIQAKQKYQKEAAFSWIDLINKPSSEFLRRYFAEEGYKDGVHGLALAILQGFSEAVLYTKLWQLTKFTQQKVNPRQVITEMKKVQREYNYWHADTLIKHDGGGIKQHIKRKFKIF